MAILSKQSAVELRRIIAESTGRNISLGEAYAIWHYLIKLLQLLWNVDNRKTPAQIADQLTLFEMSQTGRTNRNRKEDAIIEVD